jgi:hypothetical protein
MQSQSAPHSFSQTATTNLNKSTCNIHALKTCICILPHEHLNDSRICLQLPRSSTSEPNQNMYLKKKSKWLNFTLNQTQIASLQKNYSTQLSAFISSRPWPEFPQVCDLAPPPLLSTWRMNEPLWSPTPPGARLKKGPKKEQFGQPMHGTHFKHLNWLLCGLFLWYINIAERILRFK